MTDSYDFGLKSIEESCFGPKGMWHSVRVVHIENGMEIGTMFLIMRITVLFSRHSLGLVAGVMNIISNPDWFGLISQREKYLSEFCLRGLLHVPLDQCYI